VIKPARGLGLRFCPKKLDAHLENLRASYLKLKANKGAPRIGVKELPTCAGIGAPSRVQWPERRVLFESGETEQFKHRKTLSLGPGR
jgi:hypothetical protein